VGVDYALFAVASVRRRLAGGATPVAAAAAAFDTAHTIVVSAIAVSLGFGALLLVNVPTVRAIAIGGMAVVIAASALSLTLLPVVLSWMGQAVNWPRTRQHAHLRPTVWDRGAAFVMQYRWPCLVAGLAALGVLALPVLRLQPWSVGVADLSPELEARQGYDRLARAFEPGLVGPVVVSVQVPPGDSVWQPSVQAAIASVSRRLLDDTRISSVGGVADLLGFDDRIGEVLTATTGEASVPLRALTADVVSRDGRTALLLVVPAGPPESRDAASLVRDLERDEWPELKGSHAVVGISGTTAMMHDFDSEVSGRMRSAVVPAVVGTTFLVLTVAFRSVLIPLKAIALNVLSVAASYGFLVSVFQDGYGAELIDLTPPGGLNSLIVLVLFAVLFGLSMDYHVFLLSAIRDAFAVTGETKAAVVAGVRQTAGPVTGAALVMVCLFLSFGFTRLVATRELGLGLACAVALDATVVRLVLLPASMAILGKWNWWLPFRGYTPPRAGARPRRLSEHAMESRSPRRHAAVEGR
jgi:RND superfamily putative drug exporter